MLYALWPLHLNRFMTAALALAITLVYATISWFAFEKRLIFGSPGNTHAPLKTPTHPHSPPQPPTQAATGGRVGTARQAPQSRA